MEETKELQSFIPGTPAAFISQAIEKGDINALERLVALQERWEAAQARKSFFNALGQFQSDCPELMKTKSVKFKDVEYKYAPLSDIARQIRELLKDNNLSYRWEIQDSEKEIKVTCLVTHNDGHTEKTTMTANPDTTGSKNAIQARGSAIEYLKRYSLIGALGITTADTDIDARLPEIDMEKLHKEYMGHYNQLIQLDPKLTKWHPDNWKTEPTGHVYVKAISEIRKELAKHTKPEV